MSESLPLVGISACLAGLPVRYDGRDRFSLLVAEQIAPHCRLLPFCPEAVAGMGIPRAPIQLVQTASGIRARGRDDPAVDVTDRLQTVSAIVSRVYPRLCGFILQSRSPSCGLGTTPVFDPQGRQITSAGSGLFAAHLRLSFPAMPLLGDNELDKETIDQFLEQVRQRAQQLACDYSR